MSAGHLLLSHRVGFLRPLAENLLTQQAHLLDDARLGLVGATPLGQGLVEQVGDGVESFQQIRTACQTLLQIAAVIGDVVSEGRLLVHEPLHL